jgi:hypothetical protein
VFPDSVVRFVHRIRTRMATLQRAFWNGRPERLPDGFRMAKPKRDHTLMATCEVWTNPFGLELRLMIDGHGMQMTSVVRSAAEMHDMLEQWEAAMLTKGWS